MDASVSVGMKHGERGEKKKTHLSWDEECRRRRRLEGRRHAGQPSRRTCLSRRRIVWCVDGTVRYGGRWTVIRGGRDTRRAQQEKEEVGVDGVRRRMAEGRSGRTGDGRGRGRGTGMDCSRTQGSGQVPKVQGGGIGGFFLLFLPCFPQPRGWREKKRASTATPKATGGGRRAYAKTGLAGPTEGGGCHSSLGRLA